MAYRVLLRLIRPTAAAAAVPIAKELGPRAAQRLDLTTNPPSDLGQERRVAVGLLVGVNGRIAAQLGSKVTPGRTSQATAGTTPQTGPSVIPEMSAWTTLTAANVPFLEYLWRRGLPDLPLLRLGWRITGFQEVRASHVASGHSGSSEACRGDDIRPVQAALGTADSLSRFRPPPF